MNTEILGLLQRIKHPRARAIAAGAFLQGAGRETEFLTELREEAWSSPDVRRLTLMMLRTTRGWERREIAKLLGVSPVHLSNIELGRRPLSREDLERVAAAKGLSEATLHEVLLLNHSIMIQLDTAWEMVWQESLAALGPAERRARIEEDPNLHNWGLGELLCDKSRAAADPTEAVVLAELALLVAELAQGPERFQLRHLAYAWGHLGHALKKRGDQAAAEAAFEECIERWTAGEDFGRRKDRSVAERLAAIVPAFPPYEPPPRRPSPRKRARKT